MCCERASVVVEQNARAQRPKRGRHREVVMSGRRTEPVADCTGARREAKPVTPRWLRIRVEAGISQCVQGQPLTSTC